MGETTTTKADKMKGQHSTENQKKNTQLRQE